jgi:hypothetical protein
LAVDWQQHVRVVIEELRRQAEVAAQNELDTLAGMVGQTTSRVSKLRRTVHDLQRFQSELKEECESCTTGQASAPRIKDSAAGGEILEVEKGAKKDGTVVHEAEVRKADGKKVDIQVAADGKLTEVEDDEENDDQDNDKDEEN